MYLMYFLFIFNTSFVSLLAQPNYNLTMPVQNEPEECELLLLIRHTLIYIMSISIGLQMK